MSQILLQCFLLKILLFWGCGQDGRRVRRGDHLPSQRYIRNTSARGTTPTEHHRMLAEDVRPPKRQETPQVLG